MSKFTYTEEMVARIEEVFGSGDVTEEDIQSLVDEFEFPRRSVTAKARKLGYDVPRKPAASPVFDADETDELKDFLENNSGKFTAEEIAATFMDGKFNSRQINGKALSLEMTDHIKPAEKKVTPKTFTEDQESTIRSMVDDGAYIEDIAKAVDKTVASVRGKLLSMNLKAPQRDKKATRSDPYDGIEDMTDKTVSELAEHFGKTERGVKTVLTRRKLACADYEPKVASEG